MRTTTALAAAVVGLTLAVALTGCGAISRPGVASVVQGTSSSLSSDDTVEAHFIRVIDGDTIAVQPTGSLEADPYGEHSVRLLGIDAPEMHKTSAEGPDCGAQAATDHLKALLADRYGRSLAYVEAGGHDLNLEQAQGGFAEAWYPYGEPAPTHFATYDAAAKTAETSKAGSWGACGTLGR
jgi:micrococcal nuclease